MKRLAFTLVLASLGAASAPNRAEAACGSGRSWDHENMPIPVYINENLVEICDGPFSTCSSFADVQQIVEAATARWWHESEANLRFDVLGATTVPAGKRINGAIHIFAGPCAGAELGITSYDLVGPGETTWNTIRICTDNSRGPLSWKAHGDSSGGSAVSFHNVLMGELSYAVGMDAESCGTTSRSLSSATQREDASHLFRAEAAFVDQNYGWEERRLEMRTTVDGETFFKGEQPSVGPQPSLEDYIHDLSTRSAASNSAQSSHLLLSGIRSAQAMVFLFVDGEWKNRIHPMGLGDLPGYQGGSAARSENEVAHAVLWLDASDPLSGGAVPALAEASNGGPDFGSWDTSVLTSLKSTNSGIALTYDPESDAYLSVWRGPFLGEEGLDDMYAVNEIVYNVGGSDIVNIWSGVRAVATPSVACGPVEDVGAYNCLMAWSSAETWAEVVRFAHFRVTGDSLFEFSPEGIQTHAYAASGGPSVAYFNGIGSQRWLLGLSQNGAAVYTWEKGAAPSDAWANQRSFSVPGIARPPTVGSRGLLVDQAHVIAVGICPDVGAADYCSVCGPCETGQGDCDSDGECRDGFVCSHDVGAEYGLPSHYDVCECPVPVGHFDYCALCGPCDTGDGDCDSSAECRGSGTCSHNVGAEYGLPASYDVCENVLPLGEDGYCAIAGGCDLGMGGCDDDSDCLAGLVCSSNVGAQYGFDPEVDVCECPLDPGHINYCRDCGPCLAGSGDCDSDAECEEGAVCLSNVGLEYGLPAFYDVCGA